MHRSVHLLALPASSRAAFRSERFYLRAVHCNLQAQFSLIFLAVIGICISTAAPFFDSGMSSSVKQISHGCAVMLFARYAWLRLHGNCVQRFLLHFQRRWVNTLQCFLHNCQHADPQPMPALDFLCARSYLAYLFFQLYTHPEVGEAEDDEDDSSSSGQGAKRQQDAAVERAEQQDQATGEPAGRRLEVRQPY